MELEARIDWESALGSDPEVRRLVRSLTLSSRFHFYLLVCNAVVVASAVLAIVERDVGAARGSPVRVVRLEPYRAHADMRTAITKETLAAEVLERLVSPEDKGRGTIWVVDASRAASADDEAWEWLFQRMNEQRNVILKHLEGELIVCIPPRYQVMFARSAPDLWSIRSGEVSVTPRMGPAEGSLARGAGRMARGAMREEERSKSSNGGDRAAPAKERISHEASEKETDDPSELRARAVRLAREADALMTDARTKLDDLNREEALETLAKAVEIGRRFVTMVPESPGALVSLAAALIELGDVASDNADLVLATTVYDEALSIWRQVVPRDPNRSEWIQNLSAILARKGDIHKARRDLTEALNAYEESLALARQLFARDYDHPEWMRNLSVTLNRVGNVYLASGDFDRALAAYEESLALTRLLLVREPDRPEWLRDLYISMKHVGDVHEARGDLDGALKIYEEALPVMRALLARDPDMSEGLHDLSVGLANLGNIHKARGDRERALTAYEEGRTLTTRLLARDPDRPAWLYDLAVSLANVGHVHRAHGNLERALTAYKESLALTRRLLARYPDQAELLHDLSVTLVCISLIHLALGDIDQARVEFEEGRTLVLRLLKRNPSHPIWLATHVENQRVLKAFNQLTSHASRDQSTKKRSTRRSRKQAGGKKARK